MTYDLLFLHGGGEDGFETDVLLADSLQKNLGSQYIVHYPRITPNQRLPDFGWLARIDNKISMFKKDLIIVAHSFGASMVLKYLSENNNGSELKGLFLLATPFWSGNEAWIDGIKLPENFAVNIPNELPVYFYHAKDDKEVPYSHMATYRKLMPKAEFHVVEAGGHPFNNDLTMIADKIKALN